MYTQALEVLDNSKLKATYLTFHINTNNTFNENTLTI